MLDENRKFREIATKIRDMGYCGSDSTIRMYASRKHRHDQAAAAQCQQNADVVERKYLLKLLYKPMDKIKGFTKQQLDKVLTLYPQLLSLYDLIRDFKAIFAAHHPEDLEQWLASAAAIGKNSPKLMICRGVCTTLQQKGARRRLGKYGNWPVKG